MPTMKHCSPQFPTLTPNDTVLDHIHRLPKPSHIPAQVPSEMLLRLHFFHVKEQIMQTSHKMKSLPELYDNLQLFTDLSQYTMQLRKNLNTIIKTMRNNDIPYQWKYPIKLLIHWQGNAHIVTFLDKGLRLLKSKDIIASQSPCPDRRGEVPRQVLESTNRITIAEVPPEYSAEYSWLLLLQV